MIQWVDPLVSMKAWKEGLKPFWETVSLAASRAAVIEESESSSSIRIVIW